MNGKPIGVPKRRKKNPHAAEIAAEKRKDAIERLMDVLKPTKAQPILSTEWTVMAYLAGDNNLQEEMVLSLQELIEAAEWENSPGDQWRRLKILAQLDPTSLGLPTQRYVFNTTNKTEEERRYVRSYLQDPNDPNHGYSPNENNTGNPEALVDFAEWAADFNEHETGKWALILSGHGSGATENFLMKDENPVDALSIPELVDALEAITATLPSDNGQSRKLDLLGMDCCFMSMVEVCFEVRTFARHFVGAESFVPDFGWPYSRILKRAEELRWHNKTISGVTHLHGPVSPEELAEIIVEQYIEFYSDYDRTAGRSVDMAWIDLDEAAMNNLRTAINNLGSALSTALGPPDAIQPAFENRTCIEQIVLAHWEAQTYKFDQFADIRDFCERLQYRFETLRTEMTELEQAANLSSERISAINTTAQYVRGVVGNPDDPVSQPDRCQEVLDALEQCVKLSGCSGFAYQHSYGLSIYFPWACVSDAYMNLTFAQGGGPNGESPWTAFLENYVELTRRDPRMSPEPLPAGEEHTMYEVDGSMQQTMISNLNAAAQFNENALSNQGRRAVKKTKLRQLLGLVGSSSELAGGGRYHRSRYHMSRYHMSRYHMSRWPGDREKSVKNFTPVEGTAYWQDKPDPLNWQAGSNNP